MTKISTSPDANDLAFPSGVPRNDGLCGLTVREYFAIRCYQALLSGDVHQMEAEAVQAVRSADALIAALNEVTPDEDS